MRNSQISGMLDTQWQTFQIVYPDIDIFLGAECLPPDDNSANLPDIDKISIFLNIFVAFIIKRAASKVKWQQNVGENVYYF